MSSDKTLHLEAQERGKAEGKAEGLIEMAQKMKRTGMDFSLISQLTGLSIEQIELL